MKPMEPWKDPIVEEIRTARQAYAKRFDYDVRAICRDLRQRQKKGEHEVVSLAMEEGSTEAGEAR